MTKTIHTGWLALHFAFLGAAMLVLCQVPSGESASRTQAECQQATARQKPSYESFFGRQGSVVAESPEWRIDLTRTEHSPNCLNQFTFSAKNKRNRALSQFKVCNETVQVDEVDLVNRTRAVVLGRVTGSAQIVNLVELPSGRVVDHFMCYRPALSPDHRLLAFVKDFPGHPGPVEISYEYIAYDLARNADYNRPHFKPGVVYDAGWPVYPAGATNAAGENILPQGSPVHNPTSGGLFWVDANTVAFSDFFEGRNQLVVANLSRGVSNPAVRTLDLDPSQIVDLDQCKKKSAPSDFDSWSKEPAGLIKVAQIASVPGKPGMACLYFVSNPCLRYTSLLVKLP